MFMAGLLASRDEAGATRLSYLKVQIAYSAPQRMKAYLRLTLWLASSLLVAGCTVHGHPARKAGTGDVAFRLTWEGLSDLDLMVLDPAGDCIAYGSRRSKSGGVLDIDCNFGTESMCEHPIENIFWPKGAAPAGEYLFWVHAHTLIPAGTPLVFRLQLLRGKEVFWSQDRSIHDADEFQGPFVYSFPAGEGVALVEGSHVRPPCGAFYFSPAE